MTPEELTAIEKDAAAALEWGAPCKEGNDSLKAIPRLCAAVRHLQDANARLVAAQAETAAAARTETWRAAAQLLYEMRAQARRAQWQTEPRTLTEREYQVEEEAYRVAGSLLWERGVLAATPPAAPGAGEERSEPL